ncbi:MAG: hypothetical protein COB53_02395 [Elusimicrobia bacterium]|nr:MAG: hypothetical protein COB53_02395 [Elusimicrobiota bacterium]
MAEITVTAENGAYRVTVSEGGSSTSHRVTVAELDYDRLKKGEESAEELVRRSFEFLLEREGKESIMSSFDLMVIAHYFPEYEKKITL